MIEKKSIEPAQLERFEESLRLSRDVAAKQVEQYKVDDNVIGQMLAGGTAARVHGRVARAVVVDERCLRRGTHLR